MAKSFSWKGGVEQILGIGLSRPLQYVLGRTKLHYVAMPHDQNAMGHGAHDR